MLLPPPSASCSPLAFAPPTSLASTAPGVRQPELACHRLTVAGFQRVNLDKSDLPVLGVGLRSKAREFRPADRAEGRTWRAYWPAVVWLAWRWPHVRLLTVGGVTLTAALFGLRAVH